MSNYNVRLNTFKTCITFRCSTLLVYTCVLYNYVMSQFNCAHLHRHCRLCRGTDFNDSLVSLNVVLMC